MLALPKLPLYICAAAVAALALVACTEDEPEAFDPDAVIAEAVAFEQNYERLDLNGVITSHDAPALGIRSQMWANAAGAEVFRTLDIDDPDQVVVMPEGAVFLKENYDLDGNPLDPMQLIVKGPPGYNDGASDYYFAMIGRDGTILAEGKGFDDVENCRDCHSSMAPNTDFIIGLPPEELAP